MQISNMKSKKFTPQMEELKMEFQSQIHIAQPQEERDHFLLSSDGIDKKKTSFYALT